MLTLVSRSSCPRRQSSTRPQAASPGRRVSKQRRPPISSAASATLTSYPRRPSASAHDEYRGIAAPRGNALRVPAAAPLLADGRVLCTAHRHAVVPTRDADVAADALADVLFASGVDLRRQERVGDRGACG